MNGNGVVDLIGITLNTNFTSLQPLGGGTTTLPIVYYVPLHEDYIQMSLFPGIPK